jgi:hypothetical protein
LKKTKFGPYSFANTNSVVGYWKSKKFENRLRLLYNYLVGNGELKISSKWYTLFKIHNNWVNNATVHLYLKYTIYYYYCSDTLNFGKPDSSRQWYNSRFLLWYLFSF